MKLYFFRWVGGGYNTLPANSIQDAIAKGNELGKSREFSPGKWTVGLVVNEKTVGCADQPLVQAALDECDRYYSID